MLCNNCNINWAKVWMDESDSEGYEFCPVCKTDMHLTESHEQGFYIMCHITGNIYRTDNGQLFVRVIPEKHYPERLYKPKKRLTYAEREALEEKAIENYIKSGNPKDYFNTFKNL